MNCPKCGVGNPEGTKFCAECGTDLTDLSGYDQPEAEAKYRELLIDLLGDGILEDWEEKSLEQAREELKISFTCSKQMQAELGGSTNAPPPVAIFIDIAHIRKFQVGHEFSARLNGACSHSVGKISGGQIPRPKLHGVTAQERRIDSC